MGTVTVFGSLNLDIVTSVPRLPGRGETVAGGSLHRLPGGKGANQAVACARAGAAVRMVGAWGADEGGDLLLRALGREGVDTEGVRVGPGVPTGTATILVEQGGENMIAVTAGANGLLDDSDVAVACGPLGTGDVLLMQCEVPLDAVRRAGRLAASRGATVVLNVAPVPEDLGFPLPDVDVLLVNEHEARLLEAAGAPPQAPPADASGRPPSVEDCVRSLALRNDCLVVATLGAGGAIATRGGDPRRFPAPSVEATDTVGAGDAFAGYFAAALGRGADEASAIETAVLAASVAVTRPGTQEAFPRHHELGTARTTGGN